MGELDKKVAIITGGGTGIGRTIALTFAKEGVDVAVSSRDIANLEKVAGEIRALGRRSLAIACDVRVVQQVRDMVKRTIDELGRIDILVNNAGIVRGASLLEMSERDWDDVIDTNLKGTFLCTQAVARYMMEQRYGKIINISSSAGRGNIAPRRISYSAAKAGVILLTKSCAMELGPYGINVNAIAPGMVVTNITFTDRTPDQVKQLEENNKRIAVLGRLGTTQDMANLVLFLVSEKSSFICGETIAIDGGRTDRM